MSEENGFDHISRLRASSMPRRQALGLIAKTVGGTALAYLLPAELLGSPTGSKKEPNSLPLLKMPVLNFKIDNVEVDEVVDILRIRFRAPVSFFRQHDSPKVSINVNHGTVQDVLHQLRQQVPTYQVKEVKGRTVLFDDARLLSIRVPGIDLVNVPRPEATFLYSTYLQQHVKGFEHFGTRTVGYMSNPSTQLPVTLSRNTPFIQNLVELLGDDRTAAFTVLPESTGWLVWTMTQVPLQTNDSSGKPISSVGTSGHTLSGSDNPNAPHQLSRVLGSSAAAADTTCRPLSVSYNSPQSIPCTDGTNGTPNLGGTYGVAVIFTVTGVTTCPGDHCAGHCLNEQVTQSSSCSTASINQNQKPCAIPLNNDGSVSSPTGDTYVSCGTAPPPSGCTTTLTQTLTVTGQGGGTAAVNTIAINVTAGTVAPPSQVPGATLAQCCGSDPPSTGAGSKTLCDPSDVCIKDIPSLFSICCPGGTVHVCGLQCCAPGDTCVKDVITGLTICCPSGSTACHYNCCAVGQVCLTDSVTKHHICCPAGSQTLCGDVCCVGQVCAKDGTTGNLICCPASQLTSDNKLCCPSGQSPQGTICCTTGQTNCGGKCCANTCCGSVCCAPGQTCVAGACCGQPSPQTRMSAEAVRRGSYATDDLSVCCPPGQPPCGNICCSSGSVCCSGSCCAGTCDNTGACVTDGENK